jgi:serine/threonine protein kinase
MRAEDLVGRVLAEKYRIDRVLGRGGMGVVVEATHLALRDRVAIKFLAPEVPLSPEAIARFEREARATVRIKGEHVVRVLDVDRLDSGAPYVVMEYLEGEDLAARLRRTGPLPVEQAVDFVLQAGVAVAEAHAAGIVHRDLKPANLFCTRRNDGQALVKVLDFGISKFAEVAAGEHQTRTNALLGSPLYMSPEQLQNSKDVDRRSDLWALGVVLFELISGRTPFSGRSMVEVALQIASSPPPSLVELRRDVPPGLEHAIARCLTKDRDRRYSDLSELARALRPFASKAGAALVDRIVAIADPGGAASLALSATLPATGSRDPETETAPPWSSQQQRARTTALLGRAVVAVVAVVVLLAVWSIVRARAPEAGLAAGAPSASTPHPGPAPEPKLAPEPEPRVEPSGSAAAPASSASGSPPSPAISSSTSATPGPRVRAAPKAGCTPPYTVDAEGRKLFKSECYY